MKYSLFFTASTLLTYAIAAPILVARQGAGVGDGCNAIFTDSDTASGQVVKQGGAYIAKTISGTGTGRLGRRQGAGVGQGCDAILTDADTASGQVVKQGGAYVAKQAGSAPAVPGKRQLDKMGAGVGYVVEAIPGGSGKAAGETITDQTGTIDGNGTNGSAMAGETVGDAELDIGNGVTETAFGTTSGGPSGGVSKRQLDKMGAGVGYVVEAVPGGSGKAAGETIINQTGTIDGNGTEGSAKLGEAVGQAELNAGDSVTETAFGTTTNGGTSGPATGGNPPPPPPKKGGPKA